MQHQGGVPCMSLKDIMQHALDALNQRRLATQARMQDIAAQSAVDHSHAYALCNPTECTHVLDIYHRVHHAPEISVALLSAEDAAQLWDFEQFNQAAFEDSDSPHRRSSAYLANAACFKDYLAREEDDHQHDRAYHYLIRRGQELIGCIDLLQVQRLPNANSAELTWYIRPHFATSQHKSQAVRGVLNHAFYVHDLAQVNALVQTSNASAVAALIDNGFMLREGQDATQLQQYFVLDAPRSHEAQWSASEPPAPCVVHTVSS